MKIRNRHLKLRARSNQTWNISGRGRGSISKTPVLQHGLSPGNKYIFHLETRAQVRLSPQKEITQAQRSPSGNPRQYIISAQTIVQVFPHSKVPFSAFYNSFRNSTYRNFLCLKTCMKNIEFGKSFNSDPFVGIKFNPCPFFRRETNPSPFFSAEDKCYMCNTGTDTDKTIVLNPTASFNYYHKQIFPKAICVLGV